MTLPELLVDTTFTLQTCAYSARAQTCATVSASSNKSLWQIRLLSVPNPTFAFFLTTFAIQLFPLLSSH